MRRILLLLALLCLVQGCASKPQPKPADYQTVSKDPRRDTDMAKAENARAIELMNKGDEPKAEEALKRALSADIMFGPAHNNLGKIYFRHNKLYLAAWEFEYAAKLMPNQAEPKNNMGLVFESAGKWNDAVTQYDAAMKLEPDNSQVIGNAARARLRRGDNDQEVRDLLSKLIMRDTRPQWVDWARRRLALLPPPPTTHPTTEPPIQQMQPMPPEAY